MEKQTVTNANKYGLEWYEPGQNYAFFDGKDFLDSSGLALVNPNDYDFNNGFFQIGEPCILINNNSLGRA